MPTVETVINKPLSGAEVQDIVINKLRERLSVDTRLSDYMAYPAFEFKLTLVMVLQNAAIPNIEHDIEHKQGKVPPDGDIVAVTTHVTGDPQPPNQARVEAGIDVPVLTHDEKGRQIEKGVHYDKETLSRNENRQAQQFQDRNDKNSKPKRA